jgi:2-iminobutanoate/2-iminopropanoate deaminase
MKAIETGLPSTGSPMEWATVAGSTLYTAQIPIRADGSYETGDIRAQTDLTLRNLVQTLDAAGLSPGDVAQVTVYLTDVNDKTGYNEVYRTFFTPPYPNRATIIVAALGIPGMRIEVVAQAVGTTPATAQL